MSRKVPASRPSRSFGPQTNSRITRSQFTAEFLSDIGAFDISEAMSYAVNVEYQMDDDRATTPNGNETVGGYQRYPVRGLTASVAQNYFNWNIPAETALIERIAHSSKPRRKTSFSSGRRGTGRTWNTSRNAIRPAS